MPEDRINHRFVDAGPLRMHIAEAGQGPLVLLLHGFPESWYSWRHQLTDLAGAGFHAVAPDQRGYCQTGPPGGPGQPAEAADFTMLHLTGDVIALMDALGEEHAVLAGHDWGAPVAWNTALFRPDRIRGVVGLSVPYLPRGSTPPLAMLRALYGDSFYMVYFQQPGVAEAELGRDPAVTFRRLLYALSAEGGGGSPFVPAGSGLLGAGQAADPAASHGADRLPGWLTEQDIASYVSQYAESGFAGPLHWYRNLDRNWELTAPWLHAHVTVPALFIAGAQDMVISYLGGEGAVDRLADAVPRLTGIVMLPDCGHWTQQERPAEVSAAMLDFLHGLG
jgi:pimeloyl-ACP methyl ester carboxylesterase